MKIATYFQINELRISRMLRISKQFRGLRKYSEHSVSSVLNPMENFRPRVPIRHQLQQIIQSRYGGRFIATIVVGVGLGPELTDVVNEIFYFAKVPVDLEAVKVTKLSEVDNAILSIRRNGSGIKTNIEGAKAFRTRTDINPNVAIRQDLDLYLNIVHCKPYPNFVNARFSGIDVVLIRQNTEGEYAMMEHQSVKGVIQSLKVITKYNSERIAVSAFRYATEHNRKKITIVHKANIMKLTDGLFLHTALEVAKNYPHITVNSLVVDNCCMQLLQNLEQFDVILLPNLYGNIVSNIVCGLLGGPGLYSGSNYGTRYALFESASRSIGFKLAGQNVANPIAILNAAVDLLNHLHLHKHATLIEKSMFATLADDKIFTRDVGGKHSTSDVVASIKENIDKFRLLYTSTHGEANTDKSA